MFAPGVILSSSIDGAIRPNIFKAHNNGGMLKPQELITGWRPQNLFSPLLRVLETFKSPDRRKLYFFLSFFLHRC